MAQQFDYPKTETELRVTLDALYQTTRTAFDGGERPAIKGLVEIMSAKATIITAIHNIKSNKGSETPGVDDKRMQKDYLQKSFNWVIKDIQGAFSQYVPQKIRREYIDKPGKSGKRPLGIPTIRDRIVQECIRIVLEPILEAQFFEHSYGFRPMRDAQQALVRVTDLVFRTGYFWIVEGDISKCFDKLNHSVMLKHLYHMGIKDRRVIQIVKVMMKAGIIGECEINEDGVSQGGVLSPLLANASLDILDEWITRQWERKATRYSYQCWDTKSRALRWQSNLMPGYMVRYADDFVILTDSREHAECWKENLQNFLQTEMKLTLSSEKTLITDVRRQHIHFLGYEYKVLRGNGLKGYITKTTPDRERLQRKVDTIADEIKAISQSNSREEVIKEINRVNSKIRGIVNYYSNCTCVSLAMRKHAWRLQRVAMRWLWQYKGKWIPARETRNLPRVHEGRNQRIPAISYQDMYIGVTSLSFCKWEKPTTKNRDETPFTENGRHINYRRTRRKRQNTRLDDMYNDRTGEVILHSEWGKHFNFEFYMNRAYALNRDRLKCRVCGGWLTSGIPYAHRINPKLPQNKVNKVNNLASVHKHCWEAINNPYADITGFDAKTRKKLSTFREKAGIITC